MPTRRLPDPDQKSWVPHPCMHPEHNPPKHMVFQPGHYEHECPGCGRKQQFFVQGVVCETKPSGRSVPFGSSWLPGAWRPSWLGG